MPEANKPIDFSDLATPVKQGEGLDFSDLATKATSQPEVESAQDYEKRGGFFSNNEFARAVARSTANSAASVLDFVRTFADSDSLKSTADSLSNLARNIPSKANSLDDVMDDPSLIPAYVAKVVGELAPQAVMAYLSGGTGAALGRAAGLGTAGVRAATGAGAAATSIPQEVGQIARETEELTGSIDSAAALGYGIPSGALDAMSAERILGKVFQAGQPSRRAWRQVVRDTLKEIPKSAATEGLTETAQEGLHILADKAADQTFDVLTEENAKRLLESAVAGAIGGGVLGGGMSLAQLPVQKAARNEAAKNIRLTRGLEREIRTALSDLKDRQTETPPVAETDQPQKLEVAIAPPPVPQPGIPAPAPVPPPPVATPEPPSPAPPAAIVPLEEPPKPAKKIPGNWVITVQPPEDLDENTVMPGNVQVVIPGESETSTSPTIESLKAAGYEVPNYMALPKGTYTSAEAEMMLVMTPEELKRYAKERKAQAHPISEQAPGKVVEKEQTKSVPPNPEGVRPAAPAPAPEVPSGLIEVKDISKLPPSAGDLTKHKSRIKVQNDPGKAKAGVKAAGEVEVLMTISPNAKRSSGMLLIQTDQDVPRTIWSAKVSDLTQAGVAEPVSGGTRYRINLEKLWNSGLLKKTDRSNLAAYKLPNEKLERNVDLGADAVVEESAKLSPFLGAVLANLRDSGILTMAKVHALAGAKTGGHEYAGKTAAKLAAQVNKFILTVINEELRDGSRNIDTLSSTQKRELLGIAQAREKIASNEPFIPEDTQALANYLSNVSEVSVVDKPENEVPIDDVRGSSFGGDEGGEGSDSNPVGATWDPARTDSIIGVIEDKNPKLYQSFEADPEDDKAWEAIEQELVKFLNGDKVGAEILAEAVRAKRMEGWVASPGQVEGSEFEEHNWLTGLSATGKDGILALFNNRNIHLDPELRRIGLALLNRISPEYLEHLTFGVDLNGGFDGEFIPWLKTARVAINSTNAEAAAHELSHYLAQFLTGKDRGKVAAMRAAELALVKQDAANKEFVDWLEKMGGSARSIDYARFKYGEENVLEVQGAASLGTPFRFATSTEVALRQDKPFGITKDRNWFVPKQTLLAKMRNQVSKDEMEALAPIINSLPDRINTTMLANRIEKEGPQLEVVKLDAVNPQAVEDPDRAELFQLKHEFFDNLPYDAQNLLHKYTREYIEDPDSSDTRSWRAELNEWIPSSWSREQRVEFWKNSDRYAMLTDRVGPVGWQEVEPQPDSATYNYQFVNPKPLKDMPGAVDILVRVPVTGSEKTGGRLPPGEGSQIKFEGNHFGSSDRNIIGWTRGYIDTLPSGEQVFHVFEVQSDWAQRIRNLEEKGYSPETIKDKGVSADPTLAYYESAALKAAIRHARELGITKIAVSDAETAMITEGHDKHAERSTVIEWSVEQKSEASEWKSVDPDNRTVLPRFSSIENNRPAEIIGYSGVAKAIPQEPGMRLHYDQTLPNILKKMTGGKGEVVEFGQHQNAVEKKYYNQLTGEYSRTEPNESGQSVNSPRKDLIFKNPDGSPKTSITARVFDISKIDVDTPAQMFRSSLYSVTDPLYHLINDDEYFAHYMSEAAGRIKDPEFKSIVQRVLDAVKQLLDAVKEWFGNRDAYFNNLIRKFEKGQFLVHENGGMLWDRNNGERPNSLPPIKSLTAIRQFDKVDQGQEEKQLVNTLTIEQNQPLVGHVIGKLQELDRRVRAELPGITSRAAALVEAGRRGGARGETPLKHYAVLVNGLGIQEEARELTNKIQALVDEVKKQNLQAGKVSDAEQRASFLEETAKELISNYKSYLLSEQRSSKNAGVAEGLVEAIKSIDSMRDSTESLKRALEFLAQTMSLEELMADQSTQAIVNKFKEKIMAMTGASTWQQAVIPAGGERPGISNEQLRIAVRIMQERQSLVQDIITYKELSDPELVKIMTAGEIEFGNEIASLTYQKLRSFLKSYYSVRNKKDKARNIYLKHGARINKLIDDMQNKLEAEEFIYSDVIGSEQFQSAMAEAASKGFMSAELVRDNSGSDVLKRTYFNPLNKEEKIEIIDGTTKEDYERNIENYDEVATWYEEALEDEKLDPLDKEAINFELARIYETEMNPSYNPEMGKRSPGLLNAPNILSNFTGSSLSFAMQKIGGRAAIQTSAVFQARSEARRRASEVRHDLQYPMQKSILEAARSHGINISRWRKEVAEPVLASFNSIGSRPIKAGDETRYGQKVNGKDMAAVQQMKKFSDAMTKASSDMDLHTAKLHPVKVKEVVAGKEILRPQQGGTELIMPRRFNQSFIQLLENWSKVKNNRKLNEAITDLVNLVQQGAMFDEVLLPHIYSTQRFADYSNATAFGKAYREIYHSIQNRTAPTSFNQVVDIVFDSQAGTEVNKQMSKADIIKSIIGELDQMANKVLEQQARDRAANTPGSSMQILSGDNFMTKSRGQMIAPDSGYQYSVIDQKDIRWMTTSVLEVHEQLARDGLEKIKRMLQDYINEWSNRDKHADPQKESRARQISGEDWMNYRESKQMLNQINRHLDKTSPDAFRSFLDEQFGSTARKLWSIIVQSLLQSASVLKNNMLGMDLRLIQFDQQWRGDGLWMGMPKWLLKLPTIAKNGIVMPMVDLPAYLMTSSAYRKAKKKLNINGLVGEDALNAIMHSPQLFQIATAQVKASILKRAVNAQRAKELGAAGPYGARNQIERYFTMHTLGGEFIDIDDSTAGKVKGSVNSLLGIFQETGGGVMLPRALAPRKLEQFLNFQAIRYADRLIEELTGNLQQAIIDRRDLGITDSHITDAELLGDSHASGGEAMYMRSIFNKAGLNIDALIKKLESNPDRPLLEPSQWNSFVLEVAKEMNMPASDNRVTYKSGFARLMSSLMGYGMWYNERLAETLAGNSRKKIDPAAIYRGMFFVGAIIAMGVLVGTPVQRLIKRLLYDEDDQTGKFSSDSTAWRNAGVLWEQTAPFWPIIGSLMSQLYDARSGGGKIFNFLPISVASQALQFANEVGQTGNVFYPAVKFFKTIDPNLKIILNRLPSTEGLTDINSAARSLRSVADGNIELRTQKGGAAIKYSPVSTQIQMAVNEMVKDEPDYSAINHYRDDAVKYFMKHGSSREDAQRRFDLSVLARFPQNSVYGRTLSARERLQQVGRMTTDQAGRLSKVENAFDRYATTYGMRKPSEPRVARTSSGGITPTLSGRLRRRRSRRLTRNRSLARRRTRRLTRTR